jgi:hypothetical protein
VSWWPCYTYSANSLIEFSFASKTSLSIASKPLDILKKGLVKLKNSFKAKKEQLEAKLSWQESISSLDECWLDNEANTVDEQHVIDTIESSSNYERGLEHLDEAGKVIVKRLREWGGDIAKAVGKKHKCTDFFFPNEKSLLNFKLRFRVWENSKRMLGQLRTDSMSKASRDPKLDILRNKRLLHT